MPCSSCTPDHRPELLSQVLRAHDLNAIASKLSTNKKT